MADPSTPASANPAADPSAPAAAEGVQPQTRKIAPIPNKTGAPPADLPPRAEDGRFTKVEGLPDILQDTAALEESDYNKAKTTLDGSLPESAITPKVTRKARARDAIAPRPEGAPTVDAPEGAVAQPPLDAHGNPIVVETPETAAFEIAGEKYRDKAHFEQSFRSLRGMFKSAEARRVEASRVARQNYEAAIAWQGRAVALEQGQTPSPQGQGQQQPGTPSTAPNGIAAKIAASTGETEKSVIESIDWDVYKQLKADRDPETALIWAIGEVTEKLTSRYDQRLEEMVRPGKEAQALAQEGFQIGEAMSGMADWVYDGTQDAIYPELNDPQASEEIGQIIVQMHKEEGLPLKYLQTPKGIHAAVLAHRDWKARTRPRSAPVKTPNPPAPHDPVAAASASVRAAAASAAGTITGRNAPVRPAAPTGQRGAEFVQGITARNDSGMGWDR